jgi:hypothetical protein
VPDGDLTVRHGVSDEGQAMLSLTTCPGVDGQDQMALADAHLPESPALSGGVVAAAGFGDCEAAVAPVLADDSTVCASAATVPTPTPAPILRPSATPPPATPVPTATAAPPSPVSTVTLVPTSPPAAPELAVAAAACANPAAAFSAPTTALGATTTLMVSGLAPEGRFTLAIAQAPEGYSSEARELQVDATCQRTIPFVFRREEHPPGRWTFVIQGIQPGGAEIHLNASVLVTP